MLVLPLKKKKIKYLRKKKTKLKKQCKKMVIGILIKFQEHSPLKYSLVRNSSSLVSKAIVHQSGESCLRFRSLTDKLYSLGKITAQVADKAKNQFDKFIQAASFEHKESYLKFNFTEDHLDNSLAYI